MLSISWLPADATFGDGSRISAASAAAEPMGICEKSAAASVAMAAGCHARRTVHFVSPKLRQVQLRLLPVAAPARVVFVQERVVREERANPRRARAFAEDHRSLAVSEVAHIANTHNPLRVMARLSDAPRPIHEHSRCSIVQGHPRERVIIGYKNVVVDAAELRHRRAHTRRGEIKAWHRAGVELFQCWHLLVVNITPILGVIEVVAHEARFCVVAHQTLVVEAGASRSENTYR
jgi:hypothetical protein